MAPPIDERRVEEAFRAARWAQVREDFRRSWVFWTIFVAALLVFAVWVGSPLSVTSGLRGQVVGVFHKQHETGSYRNATVRLDDGRIISVWLPRADAYVPDRCVIVEARARVWFPRVTTYRLVEYGDTCS